ncbi:26S protease regulatory subunit [Pseudonocardiaceae bacterium YIM PH 21723]|nr:26S protease regulatory subunit [Pseudonocardiaceae bacterium YIM PH 21723]
MELELGEARGLALALKTLLDETRQVLAEHGDGALLVAAVTEHIGCPLEQIPNVVEHYAPWELVNIQLGVDAYLAKYTPDAGWFGIAGQRHSSVVDMLSTAVQYGSYRLGAVDYATVATGPDSVMEAAALGLVRTTAPDGTPVVLAVQGAVEHGEPRSSVLILAAERSTAAIVRDEIGVLIRRHDVFRGQVLTFGHTEYRGNELVTFLPRPELSADQVVLPEGVLAAIERHIVRTPEQTALLAAHGQHLKRGLLLYGPPGTGKTHTVRYLLSRLVDCTIIVVSGQGLQRFLRSATTLARRLAPAVVVLEDVDLVAQERTPYDSNPVLFELLNQIDGIGSEADVTFVLTTNRVEVMEKALAERPGRVDFAVEVPKPDAGCRERLLRLYAGQVDLDLADPAELIAAADGVTASFVKEWVRRAVLAAEPVDGRVRLDEDLLRAVLTELLDERQTLTRNILGG